jgi:DNA-binding NarL/FixJ family response regulator
MKVFLFDSSAFFLGMIRRLLSDLPGLKIIGEANPLKALSLIRKLKPDAVILDIKSYKMFGTDVIKNIRGIKPIPTIIMLTNALCCDYYEKLNIEADFLFDKFSEMDKIREVLKYSQHLPIQ